MLPNYGNIIIGCIARDIFAYAGKKTCPNCSLPMILTNESFKFCHPQNSYFSMLLSTVMNGIIINIKKLNSKMKSTTSILVVWQWGMILLVNFAQIIFKM